MQWGVGAQHGLQNKLSGPLDLLDSTLAGKGSPSPMPVAQFWRRDPRPTACSSAPQISKYRFLAISIPIVCAEYKVLLLYVTAIIFQNIFKQVLLFNNRLFRIPEEPPGRLHFVMG